VFQLYQSMDKQQFDEMLNAVFNAQAGWNHFASSEAGTMTELDIAELNKICGGNSESTARARLR
jgi:hypothetical protein